MNTAKRIWHYLSMPTTTCRCVPSSILESVIHADAEKLEDLLCTWLTNTISCFDEQENYYHGFVTGLVSGFNGYLEFVSARNDAG